MSRVFLAGASGAIGRPLTAMLVAAGHVVTGTTRSAERAAVITAAGARAVVVDILDREALAAALRETRPDVVIHQVTDLAVPSPEALTTAVLERNARVREDGTRNLVDGAVAVGAQRILAQSLAWLALPWSGPGPVTEEASIETDGPGATPRTRRAVVVLERMVTTDPRFDGVVLRYGRLYGPGTWTAAPPEPPTVHVDAAARAALLAVDRGAPGVYHVVDDGGPVSNARAIASLGWHPDPDT